MTDSTNSKDKTATKDVKDVKDFMDDIGVNSSRSYGNLGSYVLTIKATNKNINSIKNHNS